MIKKICLSFSCLVLVAGSLSAQKNGKQPSLFLSDDVSLQKRSDTAIVQPLQQLAIANAKGTTIKVFDGMARNIFLLM